MTDKIAILDDNQGLEIRRPDRKGRHMSETFSNNRQQRVELMKSLVRQLHAGAAEERIRMQPETVLDEADYNDVFLMEMQLIQEGIPTETIQQLCDTHIRVLKKHLDLQETPETVPGHPVHTLIQENRELMRITGQIRLVMQALAALPDQEDATEPMRAIQRHLNDLMTSTSTTDAR